MKTRLLILTILATFGSKGLLAQQLIAKAYIEKTHVSFKTGSAVGFENRYNWEYGAFYQEAKTSGLFMTDEAESQLPRFYEKNFVGVYFAAPLTYGNSFDLKVNVRTGVTNGENFSITPSILANYTLFNHIRFSAGMGVRSLRPTWQAMISFKL